MKLQNITQSNRLALHIKTLFLSTVVLLSGHLAFAQPQYSVGSTTSGSNAIPFGSGTWNSYRCQFLYLPGDFGVVPPGMAISKIYFVPTSNQTGVMTDFRVDIGQSNITGLTSSAWQAGLTTVFNSGSYNFSVTSGQWWEIELQNPIPFDPTQSLIIDARKTNTTAGFSLRNQSASPGNRRAYGPSTNASPSGASTTRYTFGFDLIPLAPDNAGISKITAPIQFCVGTHPVKVELRNSGTNPLDNVVIDWELDGVPQGTINWNTTIPKGGSAEVTLSNGVTFGTTPRIVKAWTSLPNGMIDTVNFDDTLKVPVGAGLDGIYTVGTGGDFITVKDAADALNQFGVCGAVTLDIADGVYNDAIRLGNISGASATNRITFKSQSNDASKVTISAIPTASGYVFQLGEASYITLKDLTIQSNGNNAGRVLEFIGDASHDSVYNCVINASATATSTNTSGIYAIDLTGSNDVFLNNTINRGYYGIYWRGTSSSNLTKDHVFEYNTVNDAYVYSSFIYETSNMKFNHNEIYAYNTPTTHYGLYAYYNDNNFEVIGNKIVITRSGTAGDKFGMRFYYNDGTASNMGYIVNNSIAIDNGTASQEAWGFYAYYSRYQNFINNSVNVKGSATGSQAARFYYTNSTSYRNNTIRNNVFSNEGPGVAAYIYYLRSDNSYDYNNYYTQGNNLIERGSPGGNFKTLEAWRSATSEDMHSISYEPGFMNSTDLRPDPANSSSWSLNGRALHLTGNSVDINNNTRVENRADGVPDIGAYEFEPIVKPPLATAVPATVQPGGMQEYYFGENLVATVNWSNELRIVSPLEVRQYSGRKGPNFNYNNYMYFYTGIETVSPGNTYNFDFDLEYMDIWLGNMPNETDIRLAHQFGSSNWTGYNGMRSGVDGNTNTIDAKTLTSFGAFTGTLDGEIFSADITPASSTIICSGNSVQLIANTGVGYSYQWKRNGADISGASSNTYNATQAGDYTVVITNSNNDVVESIPVTVDVISAPNAPIIASSNPIYCVGNGLTLSTQQGTGLLYQWKLDGTAIAGANSHILNVGSAGQYTVVVENIGCATESKPEVVSAGPLDVDLGNDIKVCEQNGFPITLDAGFPGATYTWNTGDNKQQIVINKTGDYWVRVDAGPNCVDIDTVKVEIDPLPSANGISYVQNGNNYSFSPSQPQNTTGYLWIFSDGTTSTQKFTSKTINGDLYVRLVLYNQCGTDTIQLGWKLGVSEVADAKEVKLYPNPAKDHITIQFADAVNSVSQLNIINSTGAVVHTEELQQGKESYTINISTLPAGYYMIRMQTGDAVISKPFNIMR